MEGLMLIIQQNRPQFVIGRPETTELDLVWKKFGPLTLNDARIEKILRSTSQNTVNMMRTSMLNRQEQE